jgi:hypothetical protein
MAFYCRYCSAIQSNPNHTCPNGDEIAQLRADLATVTAENAELTREQVEYETDLTAKRAAHAETRKALELERAAHWLSVGTAAHALESTRAELAKAEARVKELETAWASWLMRGEWYESDGLIQFRTSDSEGLPEPVRLLAMQQAKALRG